MKKITYSVAFAIALLSSSTAVAQQGFGTNRPDRSAAVEIKSSNKGLLIPRIKLTGLTDTSTIANPANSLLVFNEGTAISQGYYYWKADSSTANAPGKWIPFLDNSNLNLNLTSLENSMNLTLPNGDTKTADIINSILFQYPSFDSTVSSSKRKARLLVNGKSADLEYDKFFDEGLHVKNGLYGAIATSGPEMGKYVVKLGGDLTEPTTIHTQGNAVKIQGLSQVNDMTDQVIAVGHYQSGEIKVATPKDVVTAGIQNDITVDGTNLTSTVNSDSSTVDLTDVIRLGQETVKLISSDTSVAITSTVDTSTTNKIVTYDLKVAGVNDAIEVGNGLSKDATSRVVLGGTLDTGTTTIATGDTNTLAISGLQDFTGAEKSIVVLGPNNVLQKASLNTSNAIKKVDVNYNAILSDETILVDAKADTVTITLPNADSTNIGKRYIIKSVGNNESAYVGIKSNSIDNLQSPIESSLLHQSWTLQSDGTTWWVVGL